MGKKKKKEDNSFEAQLEGLLPASEEKEEAPEVTAKETTNIPPAQSEHSYAGKGPVISKKRKEDGDRQE